MGEMVECGVDVEVIRGIDQRTGIAFDVGVITLAVDEMANLLHVGCPVDFGVWPATQRFVWGGEDREQVEAHIEPSI